MEQASTVETKIVKRRAPSAKRALTKAQKEKDRGFPLPLTLTCTVTGKSNKYTSLPYIRKLIEKHGDLDTLKKNYVSNEGKKIQKSTTPEQ